MKSIMLCSAATLSSYLVFGFTFPTISMLVMLTVGIVLSLFCMFLDGTL